MATNWTVLTVSSLYAFLDAAQLNLLRTGILQGGPENPVTLDSSADKITHTAHGLSNGDQIMLSGNLPPELYQTQSYFVVNKTANDYQIAATSGGTAIDFSTNGTGTITDMKVIQGDPFTDLLPHMASRVRTFIASNPRNVLSATANSVPPECVWILAYLMIESMQGRIPQFSLNDGQKSAIKDAKTALDDIRKPAQGGVSGGIGYVITYPSDPETLPTQTIKPSTVLAGISSDDTASDTTGNSLPDRQATRRTLHGL